MDSIVEEYHTLTHNISLDSQFPHLPFHVAVQKKILLLTQPCFETLFFSPHYYLIKFIWIDFYLAKLKKSSNMNKA